MSSLEIKTKDTPELSEKELKQKQIENKEKREKALKEYEEERKPHIEQKLIFLYKQETKVCKLEKDYLKIKEWDEIIEKGYKEPEKCMIEFKKAEEYANKGLEELEANEKKLENNKEQEENREEIIFDKDIKKELIEKFKEIKELSSLKKENYILNIISESILTSNDDYFHLELNSENILKLKEDIGKSLNKDVLDVNDNDIKELKNNTNKLKEVILGKVLKKNKGELTYYGANVIDKNKEDRTDIENILSGDLPYKEKITKAIEFSNKVNPKKTREFIENMETHGIMENLKESFGESVEGYSSQEFLSFLFAFGYLGAASKIGKGGLKKAMIDMSVITTFDVSSRAVDNFIKGDFEKMPFNEVQIMLNMLLVLALKGGRTERGKTINNNQKETSSNAGVHKKALDPFAALNNLSYRVIVPSSVFAYGLNLENVMSGFEGKTDKNFKLNNEFEELVKKSESGEISEGEFRDKGKELIEKIFNEKLINKIPEDTEGYEILLKQLEIEKEKNKKMFEIVFIDMIDTKQINDKDGLGSEYFREVVVEKLRERITGKKDSEYEDREGIRLE